MLSWDRLSIFSSDQPVAGHFGKGLVLASLALFALAASAQPIATPSAPAAATAATVTTEWLSLSAAEQSALSPLAKHWNALSEGQKRKWLAVAATYSKLAAPDREKLHSRMVEWAALSPKDRELARLNFAQTKTITKSDRAADWEAYQALSPDERKKLADGAKVRPVGAAVAIKPVAPDKLAAVPVTRHTPERERSAAAAQRPLNRNTLLPQVPASAPPTASSALPTLP
jgi:hypothetical protein